MFNKFLYVRFCSILLLLPPKPAPADTKHTLPCLKLFSHSHRFKEDAIKAFVTDIKISNSDKDLSVEFVCNHLIQFSNKSKAEIKDSAPTNQASLFSNKNKTHSKEEKSSNNSPSNPPKQCTTGRHLSSQDHNHTEDNCWHVHPEKAPKWWQEAQAKWKASKSDNYFMLLVTLWIKNGDNRSKIFLDSGSSSHVFNDARFFDKLELKDLDVIKTGKEGASIPIKGLGIVILKWGDTTVALEDCLYVVVFQT
ncbi:hypothetical protein PCASD_01262 [Puccinia coronata f. sp. avenae]|uniref:Retrovirus-related Pol polyprotein from transposon TNT 1-94-like beta-barrel domain-containing protein n=1 Tax=Puccinia coronata f. sp. avenae TaxID=200324 RepID=A0A2N5VIY7_9BASI|nr:hypothetical protein PCASD_01262 [Puccinia coronata f. sp. avenae]